MIMKLKNILILTVTALFFASCSTTLKQRKSVDDLYYNPSQEQETYNLADDFSSSYEEMLEEKSVANLDSTIDGKEEKVSSNPYDDVLVDSYDEAYDRRQRAVFSSNYMLSNHWDIYFSDAYWYAQAYDPMFYNIVAVGGDVWVEPRWMTRSLGFGYRYYTGSPFYHSMHWGSPYYYSPFYNYGFGFGHHSFYGSYGYYSYYNGFYGYGSYHGYYGGYPYYHNNTPIGYISNKRKTDQSLRVNPGQRYRVGQEGTEDFAQRKQQNEDKSEAVSNLRDMNRTRVSDERALSERNRTTRTRSVEDRELRNRYIRTSDDAERTRKSSTYNRLERTRTQRYNETERSNTLSKYIEAADRRRSAVTNHRYQNRPQTETRTNVSDRKVRRSDGNSTTVRRRSTYSRPQYSGSSNRGSSNSTIRRSSGSSNNSSGSTIRRTRSSSGSSGSSSSSGSRSSGSSSSNRGRK
jgi:hypothetical protein